MQMLTQQGSSAGVGLDEAAFGARVEGSQGLALVDFAAPGCPPCRAMGPYVDKLAAEYQGRLKVLKINTQDNTAVPSRYGITAIPTFLLLKTGEVVTQRVGSQPYDALKKVVDAALTEPRPSGKANSSKAARSGQTVFRFAT